MHTQACGDKKKSRGERLVVGEAKESLPVMYKGHEFSISFNPEFLMAPLRNLSEEEIYLDLIDEVSPGVIKIAGPFLCVLMPMRIS